MAKVCIGIGVTLIVLGAGAYFGTGRQSVTALIPAFFGALLAALGLMALDPRRLKLAMHIAVVVALLGFGGSARGIPAAITVLGGGVVERPVAAIVQAIMAVLCGVFLVLAIRSFIAARRARTTPAAG